MSMGDDGVRRVLEYGIDVSRQTERRAIADGQGRDPNHRGGGRRRRLRRWFRRLRHGAPEYRCTCATPPDADGRHTMACVLANESLDRAGPQAD